MSDCRNGFASSSSLRKDTSVSNDEGLGGRKEFRQPPDAVRIRPMKVVDVDDQGLTRREETEEIAKRRERLALKENRIGVGVDVARGFDNHGAHDREESGQCLHVAGHHLRQFHWRKRAQVPRNAVDDPVQRLVRDGFVLVTATPQDKNR